MHTYEIEIKSLLGNKDNADKLAAKMKKKDPALQEIGSHKQLNHYFVPTEGNLKKLFDNVKGVVEPGHLDRFKEIADHAKDFSVRTRWADGKVILVIKASLDDTTSFNGTARLEWESEVSPPFQGGVSATADGVVGDKTLAILDYLDKLILDSGFEYQAKWSRERQEFIFHPSSPGGERMPEGQERSLNVSIDKNAGYGYLAEFEMVIDDQSQAETAKAFIRQVMRELAAEELMQDRLARMFDYYNHNWPDYYGTDKIFVIK